MKKEYANDEITVVWKPEKCIHSEKCWRGLPEVFSPKAKPWIDVKGAATDKIVSQVDSCPSGALSYYVNNKNNIKNIKEEIMENVKVQVFENGPLVVAGTCEIVHADGTGETKDKAAFCRCGHSATKPFCDGSHKKAGFEG